MDRHHYTATTIMTQNHHHHHYQQSTATISNNIQRGRQVTSKDIAHAIDYFEHFLNATSLKNILGYYRSICELLNLKPNHFLLFYPKLKNYLTSWRAKALWKKFDARSIHKCYGKGKICTNTRILIIGAGPCGLRTAIEAQLLGAKVVVIEKRDRLSRNNVLHLWPFVIEDLRGLGAKKFFGKFCAGSIDHISIRQLQCVLLKVALLLGVEVHTEVSFERLIEPNPIDKTGWKAEFKPNNHPVSQYEFDVIIGADGKRNTLQGFKRKEFRGKLAIAITANFINKRTEAEARVEEISGVAFIFNQKFFKDLYEDTGIDLENIVYYKDDTHYFVMTAKKTSLIDKGVIKQDLADTERLLAPDNVNRDALMNYAREAANFSTNYQMPDLEFAVNHYGQPDVAMFDFTSMYAAENASKVIERHGYRLLMILVGDSLLEPFWPTGSGCARGFLSSLDAAWAIRSWSLGTMTPLEVIAERESIYRLLAQTTPDNLNKDWKAYTLDPTTRYPNLNKNVVIAHQVVSLYDTDNPKAIEKMKRNSQDLIQVDVPKKRRRGNVDSEILVNWVSEQIREHEDIVLTDLASIFRNGKVLCAVINHYRPDLLDYNSVKDDDPIKNNQLAIDILEKEIGIPPIMTGEEITNTDDYLTMATYLTQVYDRFRGEIPHIKHPRLPQFPEFPLPPLPEKPPPPTLPDLFELLKKRIDNQFYPLILTDHYSQSERSDSKNVIENQKKDSDSSLCSVYSGKEIILKYEDNNLRIVNEIDNFKKVDCEYNDICSKIEALKTEFYVKRKPIKFRGKLTIKMESIPENIVNHKQNFVKASSSMNTRYNFSENDKKLKSKSLTKSPSFYEDLKIYPRTQDDNKTETINKPNKKLSHKSLNKIVRQRSRAAGDYDDINNNKNHIISDIELPQENKRNEPSSFKILKHIPSTAAQQIEIPSTMRISNRHKRHADSLVQINNKGNSVERKSRKRRTLEKVSVSVEERQKTLEEIIANRNERQNKRKQQRRLQTEQFLKSMQMLQANAKPDASQPFEDYSIFLYRQTAPNFGDRVKDLEKKFTYVPDHENKLPNQRRGSNNTDEDLAARIKSLEDKWKEPVQTEKKPKDLLRAIGKIETSDWNIKEIEKKIRENKLGKPTTNKDKEKVPKWSKEQFLARQTKMEKQHLDRQDSNEAKFADIDRNIKHLELKLKEGTSRDLGQNKVASITEKLVSKIPESEASKPIQKSQSRPAVVLPQGSEFCHFCGKRVYLMERLSAEGRFFHHGCFKCQYCHTQLRLGSYAFDRDGLYDHKFFCIHHYGMQGELKPSNKITRKPSQKQQQKSPEKKLGGISGVDLLDRVRTPERIEFANLNNQLSDQDESLSQMDEDEWTDKNFGASTAELGTSDEESSSLSDTESDDEDAYEEALEEPATKEGTLKWAERFNKRYSRKRSDSESDDYSSSDHSSYYENTSDDEDSETATEGEEEIRARELRKQEVRVEPPVVHTDTGTDTEVVSDESSTESSSEIRNSATEISTDSEFAHDDPTPTREIPPIVFNDIHVTKTRGSGNNNNNNHHHHHHPPKRIQVTSAYIQKRTNQRKTQSNITTTTTAATTKNTTTVTTTNRDNIELNLTPLVPSTPSILRKQAPTTLLCSTTESYALNRTQSTGGIAAKVSLELKKKYLLGNETNPGGAIQKSGSASTLDTKLKSFHSNISDCQKLLRPANEISASMQTFCNKLNEKLSPIIATTPINKISDNKELEKDQIEKEEEVYVFENELEGRPRSPLHETSIIVPKIDWNKNKSQSSDSLSENSNETKFKFKQIPKVQVDEIPPDSLTIIDEQQLQQTEITSIPTNSEPFKSICSEKKTLNQPKQLPNIEIKEILPKIHNSLHIKKKENDDIIKSDNSTPQSDIEQQTAALTETELSDWARDGVVSNDDDDDYLDNVELNQKTNKFLEKNYQHVCGKDNSNKIIITETMNNLLSKNLDNIEFMDTGTETSSDDDDDDAVGDKNQNGYILFKDDDDDINDDSLNIIDTKNDNLISKNTGYCVIGDDKINRFGEVTDLKLEDIEKFKNNQQNNDINDDDSLLIIENITIASGPTTTEENTCSDSTVKNLTEIGPPVSPIDNNSLQKKRLEEKLAKLKAEQQLKQQQPEIISSHLLTTTSATASTTNENNVIFDQHCQRLQSKIDFGNAKDSIDVRKSRRKSKSESSPSSTTTSQKPDLIQEEKSSPLSTPSKQQVNELKTTVRTPDVLYKKEFIEKERDDNQKLIQEMVMLKMKSENKSLERKKRRSNNRPFELTKSATTDIVTEINRNNLDSENSKKLTTTPPDVLLSTIKKSPTITTIQHKEIYSTTLTTIDDENKENKNDKLLFNNDNNNADGGDFITPVAPPRYKHEEAKRTAEKLRQDARLRAKFKSNEELGLSPEEKLEKLKKKLFKNDHRNDNGGNIEAIVVKPERPNSWLYSNDTLNRKKNGSLRRTKSGDGDGTNSGINGNNNNNNNYRTKSIPEILNDNDRIGKFYKSDPNLLLDGDGDGDCGGKKPKKKDRERRKSITKLFATFFKKSPSSGSKNGGIFSKISPKSKDLSKNVLQEEPSLVRRSSLIELSSTSRRRCIDNSSPPPVPPLPLNYTGTSIKGTDDSSDGEHDMKRTDRSSCDTLDQSGILDTSSLSLTKRSKSARRAVRQSQLKRHRMAQEIQRKLEETEVKTRELEERGVAVEKALRGEDAGGSRLSRDEPELLQEWFDLMRDRTELRRYEKELMVRAQELELEDRHARLQHELRERLENNDHKTEEDVVIEGQIINEMMEIVAKRDSLITLLEEDRLRYSTEDRDFEEQMLAKGLRLTPIRKTPEK